MESAAVVNFENSAVQVEVFGDGVLESFARSLVTKSKATQRTYVNGVRQLLKYFSANGITQPTTADVDSYIGRCRVTKSKATLRSYYTAAKIFFAFLAKTHVYQNVAADCAPLKLKKDKVHRKSALTTAQAKALLAAVKGEGVVAFRDRAIIAMALQCGLRTIEIQRADVQDLKAQDGYYTLSVQGKGDIDKSAAVKVSLPVAKMIQDYLNLRGVVSDDEPLFTSTSRNVRWAKNQFGNRLSAQSIGKMIKRCMELAGIDDKKITAHSCRHFAATAAIRAGADIREVSAMLRHSNLNITLTYLHDIELENRRAELAVSDTLFGGGANEE